MPISLPLTFVMPTTMVMPTTTMLPTVILFALDLMPVENYE